MACTDRECVVFIINLKSKIDMKPKDMIKLLKKAKSKEPIRLDLGADVVMWKLRGVEIVVGEDGEGARIVAVELEPYKSRDAEIMEGWKQVHVQTKIEGSK